MPDYALALHTSSPDLGLALGALAGAELSPSAQITLPRSQVWPLGRDLSRDLHVHLQTFIQPLAWSDLAWIAVAIGPGGFTGTRMGVVTARTLAQQLQIPLFGVSSLAAIAQATAAAPGVKTGDLLAIAMPAQRGEVFGSLYQVQADAWGAIGCQAVRADAVLSEAAWQQVLAEEERKQVTIHIPPVENGQGYYVEQILEIAGQAWQAGQRPDWSTVLPFYGQHPVNNPTMT